MSFADWGENRAGVPRLGRMHPSDRCSYCGHRRGSLVVGVRMDTGARALRCEDISACERRRYQKRQLELFGDSAA